MLGLIGIAVLIAVTFMYFNEIGWPMLLGAWAIVLLSPLLVLVGVSGWIILIIQGAVVGGLYLKAKSGG
jgi:hypothetical protein